MRYLANTTVMGLVPVPYVHIPNAGRARPEPWSLKAPRVILSHLGRLRRCVCTRLATKEELAEIRFQLRQIESRTAAHSTPPS